MDYKFLHGEIYGIRIALQEKSRDELRKYLNELEDKYEIAIQGDREADGEAKTEV